MKIKVTQILFLVFILFGIKCNAQHQELYSKEQYVWNGDTLNYRKLLPKNFDATKQYPFVLFLHGAGERGSDNESQLIHGSKLFVNEKHRDSFPAIVIFPQCPQDDYWADATVDRDTKPITLRFPKGGEPTKSLYLVMKLMEDMIAKSFVNKNQLYIGGLSMGAMGIFDMLSRKPNMFAAVFSICGGGNTEAAEAYANTTELWIFHGAKDDVVNPQLSIDMVSAILKYGGTPNFTLYADDNHNSWDSAFAEPELLPWLFSKSKKPQ